MSKVRTAAKAIDKADRKVTHSAARERGNPIIETLGSASEIADQPPLIALSVGTVVIGSVLRKPAVLRAGVRMLVAELIATSD